MKKKNVTFCLSAKAIEDLKVMARNERRSMSQMIEEMIIKNKVIGDVPEDAKKLRRNAKPKIEHSEGIMTSDDYKIISLINMMPMKFEDFIYFERDGIEDLDIGVKKCWIGFKSPAEELWSKYQSRLIRFFPEDLQDEIIVSDVELNPDDFWKIIKIDGFHLLKPRHIDNRISTPDTWVQTYIKDAIKYLNGDILDSEEWRLV